MAEMENDETSLELVVNDLKEVDQKIEELEFKKMLSGKDDHKNAILTIHPGAGGTESQDWAQMLMRMYERWSEKNKMNVEILDYQDGETAGIKSVSLEIKGEYAFGYLQAEIGVHRLVRLSPFDSNQRRHTSFASVFVLPEIEDDNSEIVINPSEIRIDTYRASGAGGQHVNKTESAIRITHLPTNTVVTCQTQRSQHKNKESAMKLLKSRLYEQKLKEERKELAVLEDSKSEIGFGSQIRSYVFHPYQLVKDHRTKEETGNTQGVMDGGIDLFIKAFLSQRKHTNL